MNKCVVCGKEYEAKRATSKYCSGKCRKLAFQKDRVSVPGNGKVSVPADKPVSVPDMIKDCNGVDHKIDYEGRNADAKLLESWAKGEGTPYQQRLGKLTAQGKRYMGRIA